MGIEDKETTTAADIILLHNLHNDSIQIEVFKAEMAIIPIGDGDYQIISTEYLLPGQECEKQDGWWHYWTMPGYLDRGDFIGPFDTKVEAEEDAVDVNQAWDHIE